MGKVELSHVIFSVFICHFHIPLAKLRPCNIKHNQNAIFHKPVKILPLISQWYGCRTLYRKNCRGIIRAYIAKRIIRSPHKLLCVRNGLFHKFHKAVGHIVRFEAHGHCVLRVTHNPYCRTYFVCPTVKLCLVEKYFRKSHTFLM